MQRYKCHSDKELFIAIANDNTRAFAELFDRYWAFAFSTAFSKTQSREAAQEIVQEIFIRLWDKRATLSFRNFPAYLHRSVKNRCLNFIESKLVEKRHWDYYKTFLQETIETPDSLMAYNDLLDAIHNGMESLPQKTKKVFQLNRLEGRSIQEIANVLNLSEKAIEYHLTRSLKQLRLHLKDFILLLALLLFLQG